MRTLALRLGRWAVTHQRWFALFAVFSLFSLFTLFTGELAWLGCMGFLGFLGFLAPGHAQPTPQAVR